MKFWKNLLKLLRSLQWKLVYIFISMCIILVCVVYIGINSGLQTIYFQNFTENIDKGYENWKEYRGITDSNKERLTNDILLDYFSGNSDDRFFGVNPKYLNITIINTSKRNIAFSKAILYSSDEKTYPNYPEEYGNQLLVKSVILSTIWADGELNQSGQLGQNKELIKVNAENQYFEYILFPKGQQGNVVFYFTYQKDAWEGILAKFNTLIFYCALVAVLLSLILGYLLSKTITSPIISVMHKAEKVAEGDFDQQLTVKSEDEIGNLTKTFNYMAKELKNTLSEISSEKNKVTTILNYMADGVLAYNLKGIAIHVNPAASKLLGEDIEGKSFGEFAEDVGLDIKLENIVYFEESTVRESDTIINDMYVKVYFAVFTDTNKKPEGVIVVLHDVTEQQKLDCMRREFVANVSHELRTPITSIKSYTETLLDGAVEDHETTEHFLNVINAEADRMTRLVKDLLQLSRLDNQQMSWKIEKVAINDMVKDIVGRMQLQAVQKKQKLESYVIGDIPSINADKDRLEQVVVNIISNALKYTPDDGIITVYVGKLINDIYIKVADTGIGIPKESLQLVFDRFYRVDKARSRDLGGTGLGLSIAKEIVEAQGGTITIASEVGKGTEVTVRLPLNL
ncbi:two-component system sensor histidine kinase VicK [Ruminiclostridium sufflavum DSM 19573]|uniref:histidine kinase n=1 Tax=Ruminiclostridium sufflavum DSM 19573 TaxID=1121337 RepID=A0A318XWJ9_9FIRM|nr:ATP-binding protein [Ruminiclostridium sufflavum]PYG87177.1 two-component system sensor histidine kinase VicK [Ruminiclostridium sufflavum DSM 19573]